MPSNIPLWTFGAAFRLRLVTFTDQAHRAHRPLGGILAWLRGSSDRSLARGPLPQAPRWHPRVARQASIDSSARPPCPQVPQWHPRVARGASIDPLARGPSTEPLLGQGRVPKHLRTNPNPGRCRRFVQTPARHPRLEASRWHLPVAKGTSIGTLARGSSTEALLGQGHVARLSGTGVKPVSCRCFGRTSTRHPRREASRWHPGVARQSSIGSSSIKCRCFMDVEVRMGCSSMK